MKSRSFRFAVAAIALPLCFTGIAQAGKVALKDGTTLEGVVIKQGDGYWVKTGDGQTRTVKLSEIATIDGKPVGGSKAPGISTPSGVKPGAPATASSGNANFSTAQQSASGVDSPLAAVAIWQKFIDSKPSEADLTAAKAELAKWQQLADGGAEKIKGHWVGGDERKKILEKSKTLSEEGAELMRQDQTLQAVKKLEEAAAVYPNSYETNFLLGYLSLLQHQEAKSIKYFEAAMRQKPDSPECLGNIAVAMAGKNRQHVGDAIQMFHKAAQAGDTKEIAQNLVTAVASAPPNVRKNSNYKRAEESARLLAAKYGVSPLNNWMLVPMQSSGKSKGENPGEGGIVGTTSGTGFLIAKDGLILTNRHVVDGAKTLLVLMNGSVQKSAEVVVIDDEQDLALIRVKSEAVLPFVNFSSSDAPADGAECTVMGYPLIDRLGAAIKITRGIVSSAAQRTISGPDVVIDAKVNPGNSGGPILDKHGDVMAIVSMKSLSSTTVESYGLGISAGHVRQFLTKNHVVATPGVGTGQSLSAEEIAAKVKPAAVCIIATR